MAEREAPEKEALSMADLLTELRAIRVLLEREATCPHGATGFCMDCVMPNIDYALAEITRNITNQAWGAMRRG